MTNQPIKIGNVTVPGRIFIGPMAGVTDYTYREILKNMGASLTCTEMVSVNGLLYNPDKESHLRKVDKSTGPNAIQFFGSDPQLIADMAAKHSDGFDIVDINMGCPVNKVVKNGQGSALMKDPEKVYDIVKRTSTNLTKPLTVKIRAGWDANSINALEVAAAAQEGGAAAITVHGRTRTQMYSGKADLGIIAKVKQSVSVPVIGNGDIYKPEDAINMIQQTGCDGIMLARGIKGNPWLVAQVKAALEGKEIPKPPTKQEKYNMIIYHMNKLYDHKPKMAVLELRKHLAWYLSGERGGAKIRNKLVRISDMDEMKKVLFEFYFEE